MAISSQSTSFLVNVLCMDLIKFLFIVLQYYIALKLTFLADRSVKMCEIYAVTHVTVDILFQKKNK